MNSHFPNVLSDLANFCVGEGHVMSMSWEIREKSSQWKVDITSGLRELFLYFLHFSF
jgi:hypothetical protein